MSTEKEKALENERLGMEVWIGDLTDQESLKGIGKDISTVYHLAGLHSSIKRMEDLYLTGTKNLIDELDISKIDVLIASGNSALYCESEGEFLYEDSATSSAHPFGVITKKYEDLLIRYQLEKNLKTIILRIAEVYGPGEYNPLQKAMSSPIKLLGDGSNFTSIIYIDDLLNILLLAQDKLERNQIYNVVDDCPVVQKTYYETITRMVHVDEPQWIDDGRIAERIQMSIHGLRMLSIRMSNEKIKKQLAYNFVYPSYKEGLVKLESDLNRGEYNK